MRTPQTFIFLGWLGLLLAVAGPVLAGRTVPPPAVVREQVRKAPAADALLPALRLSTTQAPQPPHPTPAGRVCLPVSVGAGRWATAPQPRLVYGRMRVFLAYFRHLFRHGISINAP